MVISGYVPLVLASGLINSPSSVVIYGIRQGWVLSPILFPAYCGYRYPVYNSKNSELGCYPAEIITIAAVDVISQISLPIDVLMQKVFASFSYCARIVKKEVGVDQGMISIEVYSLTDIREFEDCGGGSIPQQYILVDKNPTVYD